MGKPYPLFFETVYFERIWGREEWRISDHPKGRTRITNGIYAGKILSELWQLERAWFGENECGSFPLLIKVIITLDDLSVQVHPDNEYASLHEKGDTGKTEAWCIVKASPGAKVIYGHRARDREHFIQLVNQKKWDDLLIHVPVQAGQFFYVPSGVVHSIGAGIELLEIQQSSDLTYRVYDYERVDNEGNRRELHLEKAMDVILFEAHQKMDEPLTQLIQSPFFTINRWKICGEIEKATVSHTFSILSVMEGEGVFQWAEGQIFIKKRQHFLLPATLGKYQVTGDLQLIEVTLSKRAVDRGDLKS